MTELDFISFVKDGAENCFAERGDIVPTIFFTGKIPNGSNGILAIPVANILSDEKNDARIEKLIVQLRYQSKQVAFVHLACQVVEPEEDSSVKEIEIEQKHVVAILFYFGTKVEAHFAEILENENKPILLNWVTTEVNGGRLAIPPPQWN